MPGAAGIARTLLACVDAEAQALGIDALELWVVDDNQRATAVYERSGWIATEHTKQASPRSRLERCLVKTLGAASAIPSSSRGQVTTIE